MVQISQIPGNIICGFIGCGSLIPWGWGWLHRFASFAIPKLRLRLPPRIEPCQILGMSLFPMGRGFFVYSLGPLRAILFELDFVSVDSDDRHALRGIPLVEDL